MKAIHFQVVSVNRDEAKRLCIANDCSFEDLKDCSQMMKSGAKLVRRTSLKTLTPVRGTYAIYGYAYDGHDAFEAAHTIAR